MPQVEFLSDIRAGATNDEIGYHRARMATNHGSLPTMPISLFGNVALLRSRCSNCRRTSILIPAEGSGFLTSCCEVPARRPKAVRRESGCDHIRKKPPLAFQKEQLALQEHCCFWCLKAFYSSVVVRRKRSLLVVEWDHMVPYSYNQNNAPHNFVAACQFCNRWKSARIFRNTEEGRDFVERKWIESEELANQCDDEAS